MAKFLHKFPSDTEFKPAYTGETYHEPWVSLTKETNTVNTFKGEVTDRRGYTWHYECEFYLEVDGLYKWLGKQLENSEQEYPLTFWTRTRNPQVGDKVFTSYDQAADPEDEGWLTIYEISSESGARVDYNRKPYYGEGFIFDAADYRKPYDDYDVRSLKCLNADEKQVTLTPRNMFTTKKWYDYSTYEAPGGQNITVKVVNAKEIDPAFDDEIALTLPFYQSGSFNGTYVLDYEGYQFTFVSIYWYAYEEDDYDPTKPGGPGFEFSYVKNE